MSKTNVKRIDVPLPGLVAAERRECERSEPTAPGGMPVREAEGSRPARPDPEVLVKAARRHFNAEYKQSILHEVDRCRDEGAIGALLRKEGLYSSHLTTWRRQRDQAVQAALAPHKRGPKPARIHSAKRAICSSESCLPPNGMLGFRSPFINRYRRLSSGLPGTTAGP